MKSLSVFDIIGPNMIGPSSSHTAGAVKIAKVMYLLAPKDISKVTFILFGSFAKTYRGHGTDKALLAGMLGMNQEDERIRDAFNYAKESGLNYTFEISEEKNYKHPNSVKIIVWDQEGTQLSITGSSIGGGSISIDKINDLDVFFSGEYYTLLITHRDQPGIVAHITHALEQYAINIAFMRVYREHKGENAYTIIETDEQINKQVISQIIKNSGVYFAKIISL